MDNIKNVNIKKQMRRIVVFIIFSIACAFSMAFSIWANVGMGAYDAMSQSLTYITGIKVGTISFSVNIIFIFGQIILLLNELKPIYLLRAFFQLLCNALLGFFINFFLGNVFSHIVVESYVLRFIALLVAILLFSFFLTTIVNIELVSFSMEEFCLVVSKKFNISFGRMRQVLDIIFIVVSAVLTMIFSVNWTLGIGTFVIMIIFGPLIDFFTPGIRKILLKFDLTSKK